MSVRDEHGLTLIELLITMAITIIVFSATLAALDFFQSDNRFDQLRNENQDTARTTLDRLSRQLRNVVARVTSAGIAPGALEQAAPYEVTFQTIDTTKATSGSNKANAMRVRYCLNDSNPEDEILWEQVRRWESEETPTLPTSSNPESESTCPDRAKEGTSEPDWNTTTQVVEHVTNRIGGQSRPLFVYNEKETPEILSVQSDVFIDITPKETRPGESELTSGVSLRNANRRPIVAFTATPVNKYVKLNASASHDPDGLSLTYKWMEDSNALETTAQQYESPKELAGTHTFKLEVTNPGGLSACAEVSEVTPTSSSKESKEVTCPI
jgi:type II secretory pathway pseudopilin PulG